MLDPPVPLMAQPLVELANFVTISLLPRPIRDQYGFAPIPPAPLRSPCLSRTPRGCSGPLFAPYRRIAPRSDLRPSDSSGPTFFSRASRLSSSRP